MLIAASGNFGPKSPPQYPAADPNVIAVSATDVDDQMFNVSNIGPHIAVAAPGVDILLPAPGSDYQVTSGTSFSAAYVSGVAALMIASTRRGSVRSGAQHPDRHGERPRAAPRRPVRRRPGRRLQGGGGGCEQRRPGGCVGDAVRALICLFVGACPCRRTGDHFAGTRAGLHQP